MTFSLLTWSKDSPEQRTQHKVEADTMNTTNLLNDLAYDDFVFAVCENFHTVFNIVA